MHRRRLNERSVKASQIWPLGAAVSEFLLRMEGSYDRNLLWIGPATKHVSHAGS